jgi:hypothetical protein
LLWWGKNVHLEVAADEELASHDGRLMWYSDVVEGKVVVGEQETEADEEE